MAKASPKRPAKAGRATVSTAEVERQLEALEGVAAQLRVEVSYEAMTGVVAGSGGLCRVKGSYRVIIDRRLRPSDRVQVLSEALGRFDLSMLDLPDVVRPLLSSRLTA